MQQNTQFSQGLTQEPLSQERAGYGRATEEEIVRNAPLSGGSGYLLEKEVVTTTNPSQGFVQPTTFASTGEMYVPGPSRSDLGQFTQPGFVNTTGTGLGSGIGLNQFTQPGFIAGPGTEFGTATNLGQFSQPSFIAGTGAGLGTGLGTGIGTNLGTGLGTGAGLITGTQGLTQPLIGTGTEPLTTTGLATEGLTQSLSNARGTFIFRPLEGRFIKNQDRIGLMDPYCKIKIGLHRGKTAVAKSEGTHPVWNDVITIEKKHNEKFAKIKVKDHDKLTLNDKVGETKIPLNEIAAKGRVNQWFPVYKKDQMTGEVLMDITFQPRGTTTI